MRCPRCDEERGTFQVEVLGRTLVKMHPCACIRDVYQAEVERRKRQEQAERRAYVAEKYGGLELPAGLATKTLEGYQPLDGKREALDTAKRYLATLDERLAKGQGLILTGAPGTGKTHIGAAIAAEALRRGKAAIHAGANPLLDRVKNLWGNGEKLLRLQQAMLAADLLVLEDLGQEVGDARELAYLFAWLDGRYERQASTIITTNLGISELASRYGGAIISRLRERCKLVVVGGEDYRQRLKEDW